MHEEAELAFVISHEITHVTNRHAYYQNRSIRKKAVTMDVIYVAAGGAGYFPLGASFGYSLSFAAQFSQVLIIASVYGYSRELEDEADTAGYTRFTAAGYDGQAMARSFEILDEHIEFEPAQPFWRTHPKLELRKAKARKLAAAEHSPSPLRASESEYLSHAVGVVRYNVLLDLDSRRTRTAVARSQRLVAWNPTAVNLALLADAYRALGAKTTEPGPDETTQAGKQTNRKHMLRMTAEEEQNALLATPNGKATLQANRLRAQQLYEQSIAADPHLADPHCGLGMLYQDEGKNAVAAREYRAYLDLCLPSAPDRLRVERRLEVLLSK